MMSQIRKHLPKAVIYVSAIMSLCLQGCQKSPVNGYLDGQWQVMEVYPEPADKPIPTRIYYNFYMHVVQLSVYGEDVWTSGRMDFQGNRLKLDFVYEMTPPEVRRLRQYGIDSNPVAFTVEKKDSRHILLRNGETTVTLRKF